MLKTQVAVLCGGEGVRMRGYTETIPKPLIKIGDKPVLWHILKTYSFYGFTDFILCLGYMGERIREYFTREDVGDWSVTFADTGDIVNTGGRIKRIEEHIVEDDFMVTYGDGVADINIRKLLDYHLSHGKTATITAVQPEISFGVLDVDKRGIVTCFREKPRIDYLVNGGFFVFKKKIFNYLGENDVLEEEPFQRLAHDREMVAYRHKGFWKCMDTHKDMNILNQLWEHDKAEWRVWGD